MNTITFKNADRGATALGMTLYYIDRLKSKGLIEGGPCEITDAGRTACETAIADGFEFNRGELEQWMAFIASPEFAKEITA